MNADNAPSRRVRTITVARRAILLATVAGLGLGALHLPSNSVFTGALTAPAHAQTAVPQQRPAAPTGFADIVERVKPAVVSVRVRVDAGPSATVGGGSGGMDNPFSPDSPMERFFRRFGSPDGSEMPRGPRQRRYTMGQGSGFFISADGYIVTNNHVIDRSDKVEIGTDDGKTYTAKVIGTDPRSDLALLKIDGRNDFPYVRLADTPSRVGDWVIAVGNPFGLGGTVTAGIVSARGRDIGTSPYDDFIQIDAPVNRGNSGGPTFDVAGNVIGVNTAIFSPSGGSVGIGFAISAETIRYVVDQLRETGKVSRGWIGVQIQPVTANLAESLGLKNAQGALVAEVQPNSPASKSGLKAGDVITSVDGQTVKDARSLSRQIGAMAPGATVRLGVFRNGSEQNMSLSLGQLPEQREARAGDRNGGRDRDQSPEPRLGLSIAPAERVAGAGEAGVVVTDVEPTGPAAEAGIRTGDIILEVAGKAVSTPAEVRDAVGSARSQGKRTVLMRVKSGDANRFVAVPVGRG